MLPIYSRIANVIRRGSAINTFIKKTVTTFNRKTVV